MKVFATTNLLRMKAWALVSILVSTFSFIIDNLALNLQLDFKEIRLQWSGDNYALNVPEIFRQN